MSMSKKDYDVIGNVLRVNYMAAQHDKPQVKRLDSVVLGLAAHAARGDATFDMGRFVVGCIPTWHVAGFKAEFMEIELDLFTLGALFVPGGQA